MHQSVKPKTQKGSTETHSDARKRGGGTDHGIQPRNNAIQISSTHKKHGTVRVCGLQPLHPDAHYPTRTCAHTQGWDKYSRGYFDSKGHNGESTLDNHCHEDSAHNRPGVLKRTRVEDAKAGMLLSGACTTLCEKVVDKLGAAHSRVRVKEAQKGRYCCDLYRVISQGIGRERYVLASKTSITG